MPKFNYKAVTKEGKNVSGSIEALSINDALNKIHRIGVLPSEVLPVHDIRPKSGFSLLFNFGQRRIGEDELVIFTRQFAVLLNAGLPLVRALNTLCKQMRFKRMREIIEDITEIVSSGQTLSNTLSKYPKIFSNVYVNIIKAGETGGALDAILMSLAEYLEKNLKLTRKIKAALLYPLLIVVVSVCILAFIVAFVIPKFMELFEGSAAVLPLLTRIVLLISNFICMRWYFLIIIIAIVFIGYKLILLNKAVRYFRDRLKLRIPVFGILLQKLITARVARTLAILMRGGVPILQSLELTREVSGNMVAEKTIDLVYSNVREGNSIAQTLAHNSVFPYLMVDMIALGEESGTLDKMLLKVADTYDDEVEIITNSLTSLLEPFLIIIMGFIVGGVVLAMFLPLIALLRSFS